MFERVQRLFVLSCLFLITGCSSLVSNVTQGFADNLSAAILESEDLDMVRDGAPAYLILIDSLVAGSPQDVYMLQTSASLHGAYAGAFVEDEHRAKLLTTKAKNQALKATCLSIKGACNLTQAKYSDFEDWLQKRKTKDVSVLYNLGVAWAGWIQAHSDDFTAIAELARVKAVMLRVSQLEPNYENGSVFLYLGVFETLLPPAMGGKPEVGRGHFERAIEISDGQNLMAKVMFADQYARLVFERELHDQLLNEVLAAPAQSPGLTLMNTVAKEQAQKLLDSADDYF